VFREISGKRQQVPANACILATDMDETVDELLQGRGKRLRRKFIVRIA
jgi:hypothetical protein